MKEKISEAIQYIKDDRKTRALHVLEDIVNPPFVKPLRKTTPKKGKSKKN